MPVNVVSTNNPAKVGAANLHPHEYLRVGDRLVFQLTLGGINIEEHVEMRSRPHPSVYHRIDAAAYAVRNIPGHAQQHGTPLGAFSSFGALAQAVVAAFDAIQVRQTSLPSLPRKAPPTWKIALAPRPPIVS